MVHYENMTPGIFLRRPNRFIAHVEIGGREEICHVKNTGRCRELLVPGATVWCQRHDDPARKTKFSLIAVQKGARCINMDSQVPNRVAAEWIRAGGLGFVPALLQPEKTWGESRFDFYLETADGQKGYAEVKGVTLERDDRARFPDAPTQRGARHLRELTEAKKQGLLAFVVFVVQMENICSLSPNDEQDPAFGAALRQAAESGVAVYAIGCRVTPESIEAAENIRVELEISNEQ